MQNTKAHQWYKKFLINTMMFKTNIYYIQVYAISSNV